MSVPPEKTCPKKPERAEIHCQGFARTEQPTGPDGGTWARPAACPDYGTVHRQQNEVPSEEQRPAHPPVGPDRKKVFEEEQGTHRDRTFDPHDHGKLIRMGEAQVERNQQNQPEAAIGSPGEPPPSLAPICSWTFHLTFHLAFHLTFHLKKSSGIGPDEQRTFALLCPIRIAVPRGSLAGSDP